MGRIVYLTQPEVESMLNAVSAAPLENRKRVHAEIYLAFWLGLRAGEVGLLRPEHLADPENVLIPTLKASRRIPHQCPKCGRRVRLASARAHKQVHCIECGAPSRVVDHAPASKRSNLKRIPFVESHVQRYIARYLEALEPASKFMFEKRRGKPINYMDFWADFKIALGLAGLDGFTPHALRHGRAMHLYKATGDVKLVQSCLRHANTATAEIYVTLSREVDHKRVLEKAAGR